MYKFIAKKDKRNAILNKKNLFAKQWVKISPLVEYRVSIYQLIYIYLAILLRNVMNINAPHFIR